MPTRTHFPAPEVSDSAASADKAGKARTLAALALVAGIGIAIGLQVLVAHEAAASLPAVPDVEAVLESLAPLGA